MMGWIREDKIKWKETIFEGIENTPKAFIGLFTGKTLGKCWSGLVQIRTNQRLPVGCPC